MVRIQIEKLWVDDFYPWESTNYPFSTIGTEQEILTISQQTPNILFDYVIDVDTETLILSQLQSTIIEGIGTNIYPNTETFILGQYKPDILYDYTVFPNVQTLTLTQLQIRKAGNPWDERNIPGTCSQWTEKATVNTDWEERNQVLWSPFIYPWQLDLPWQVEDRIEIPVYTERTMPTTTYTERTKPTTNWN